MPRVLYAVTCDDVRQEVGNKVSLMGIFDHFTVRDFRNPVPTFYLFAKVEFEQAGDYPVTIRLRTVQGEQIFQVQGRLHVEAPEGARLLRGNLKLRFNNLRLPRDGSYEMVIIHGNETLAILPINVVVPPAPFIQ